MKPSGHAAMLLPALAAFGWLGWAILSATNEVSERNAPAKAAGFVDASQMQAAAAVGVTDAAVWREVLRQEEAKRQAAIAENNALRERQREIDAAAAAERNRDPGDRLTMPSFSWKLGGFKNVGIVSVTIANGNNFAVKDVGIACEFSGKSGTVLTTAAGRIYDTLRAKGKQTFKEVNMGLIDNQSARASCRVVTARRV